MIAKQLIVKGKVQGVYFRVSTRDKAMELGVNGWVKNLSNGDVEIHIEGEQLILEQMINWTSSGPPHANVTEFIVEDTDIKGFETFTINR
jgi:acylphosphatase